MTKFTDIFFFDYFETKKTQTGEEPQYRFDGPRAPEDLRYYMNRSIFDIFCELRIYKLNGQKNQ